jgi:hypothetical protein
MLSMVPLPPAGDLANMDALDPESAAKLPALMAQPLYISPLLQQKLTVLLCF